MAANSKYFGRKHDLRSRGADIVDMEEPPGLSKELLLPAGPTCRPSNMALPSARIITTAIIA
jgi:hypothetical protein